MNHQGDAMEGGRNYGPWKIHTSSEVYRDPWVRVVRDDVTRPDGKPGTYTVVHIKSGVSVLPIDDDGTTYLTDEFHYAVGRRTLETVSGGIEPAESAEETAHRELREEIGIEARELIALGTVDPFTASLLSPTQLFLARGLTFVPAAPEGTEVIRRVAMPFDEAVSLALQGEITHAPSCVLIFRAQAWLKLAHG